MPQVAASDPNSEPEEITNTEVEMKVLNLAEGLAQCREEMNEMKDFLSRIIQQQG